MRTRSVDVFRFRRGAERPGSLRAAGLALALALTAAYPAAAASPGLPFTEDFTSTALRDARGTTADWSTSAGALRLARQTRRLTAFGPGLVGSDISTDIRYTLGLLAGDLDGDGDIDLIAANMDSPCRFYLNNGTSAPFSGVSGIDLSSDSFTTFAAALGDVDGDGDLDFVTGSIGRPNRLYLNNGTSNPFAGVTGIDLALPAVYLVNYPTSMALADVDGDGDLDLVVESYNAGLAINPGGLLYLNNGTAAPFDGVIPSVITADPGDSYGMAVGDVNGDGRPDLVVANYGNPNRLYLNNGTADPFTGVAGVDITTDVRGTNALTLGDVDGDGDLDLVAGNQSATTRLYLNNGTADPFAGVTGCDITSDVPYTKAVVLGDVDRDGDLDLIVGDNGGPNRLYLNNGTPDPWAGASGRNLTTDTNGTLALVLRDLDGDGDLDLAVGNNASGHHRFYRNDCDGASWAGFAGSNLTSDTNRQTLDVALGDVDGDGDVDFVSAGGWGKANRLFLNNGTRDPFSGVTGSDVNSDALMTRALILGDVNGDGHLDLIAANSENPSRLYLNNGTANPFGGVTGSNISADAFSSRSVSLGDVNGDGHLDLVIANEGQPSRLYLNNGTADPFLGVTGSDIGGWGALAAAGALADVNGDGRLDFIVANDSYSGSQPSRIYLNNGTANPFNGVTPRDLIDDPVQASSIAVGDVDQDGDVDLVIGNYYGRSRLYLNNGTADPFDGVTRQIIGLDLYYTHSVELGDLDGDGDLDLVAANQGIDWVFLNDGGPLPFVGIPPIDVSPTNSMSFALGMGDVNGDGDLDLVIGKSFSPDRLYLGSDVVDSWAGVEGSDLTTDSRNTRSVAVGDLDGDGDLDLVVGNDGQTNRLYLNNHTRTPWSGVAGSDVTADSRSTRAVALGDLDRDGDLDLVVGNDNQTNRLYLNNGTADPWNGVTGSDITSDARAARAIVLGDVDRDGDLDLIVGNDNQTNRLYLNNGTANPFSGVTGSDITADVANARVVALGDVDRDGDLDLVVGNFNQPNRLYLNNGTADPWNGAVGSDITADSRATTSLILGDLDGDGDLDLIFGNESQTNRLYLNNGTADPWNGVTGSDISADSRSTRALALIDVNRDGDLDLVVGNFNQPNRLYLNNGTASPFSAVTGSDLTSESFPTTAIALADVDRNGLVDVIEGCFGQRNRYETAPGRNHGYGTAVSLGVDGRNDNIPNATLSAVATLPPNTGINWWLSNDGGERWVKTEPGREVTFGTSFGNDLRWKAELRSLSPVLSPTVSRVDIVTTDYTSPSVDLLVPSGGETWAAGSTQTLLWSASDNEGLAGFTLEYRNEELPSATWQSITCSNTITGASRSCQWLLPTTTSTAMRVRITARDSRPAPGGPNTATDQSTGTFYLIQYNSDQIRTLIVWNEHRMRWKDEAGTVPRHAAADVDALKTALSMFRFHVKVDGFVLDLSNVPSLDPDYDAWDGTAWSAASSTDNVTNATAANALGDAIRNYLYSQISSSFPGLVHLVLVGGDSQIPFFRIDDGTSRQLESSYIPELQAGGFLGGPTNTAFCAQTESPVWAAICSDRYFSDTKYGASTAKPVPGSTRSWYLPDVSVGRLVESPLQITALVDAYVAQDGVTVVEKAMTSGYDFLTDGGDAVQTRLAATLDLGRTTLTRLSQSDTTPPNPLWADTDLENQLFGVGVPPVDLAFISGHADHLTEGAAAAGLAGGLTTTEMLADGDNRGGVVIGVGCHSGLSVEEVGNPAYDDLTAPFLLDLPELAARKKFPVFVGNGGYGWGMSEGVGLGEQLVLLTAEEILRAGQISVGEALRLAKQEYFLRQDRLDTFDHKVLHESILFGIPNYEVRVYKTTALAGAGAGSWHGVDSGLTADERREREARGPRVPGRPWLGDPTWKELDLGNGRRLTKSDVREVGRAAGEGPSPASGETLRVMDFEYRAYDSSAGQSWSDAYTRFDMCADSTGETVVCSGGGGAPGAGQTKTGTFFALDGLATDNPGQPIQPMISFDSKLFGTRLHGILLKGGEFVEPVSINPPTPDVCTDEKGKTRGCFDPVIGNPETKQDQPEGPAPTAFTSFASGTPFLRMSVPTPFLRMSVPTGSGFDEASLSSNADPIRFDTLNAPMGETIRRGVKGSPTPGSRQEIVAEWLYRTQSFSQFYSTSTDWTAPSIGAPTARTFAPSAWTAATAHAVGDLVKPTVSNGHYYWARNAGTSGSGQPTWPVGSLATVLDGGIPWQETPELDSYATLTGLTASFDVPVTDGGDGVYKVFVSYHSDVDSQGKGAWRTIELSPAGNGHWTGSIDIVRTTFYLVQAVDWAGNIGCVREVGQDLAADGQPLGSDYSLPRLFNVAVADGDSDGLPDWVESNTPGLDAGSADSDGDGIPDALDDLDHDGLSNIRELELGMDPADDDMDDDGDNDGSELNNGRSSLQAGDGLRPTIAVTAGGWNPLVAWPRATTTGLPDAPACSPVGPGCIAVPDNDRIDGYFRVYVSADPGFSIDDFKIGPDDCRNPPQGGCPSRADDLDSIDQRSYQVTNAELPPALQGASILYFQVQNWDIVRPAPLVDTVLRSSRRLTIYGQYFDPAGARALLCESDSTCDSPVVLTIVPPVATNRTENRILADAPLGTTGTKYVAVENPDGLRFIFATPFVF